MGVTEKTNFRQVERARFLIQMIKRFNVHTMNISSPGPWLNPTISLKRNESDSPAQQSVTETNHELTKQNDMRPTHTRSKFEP